MSDALLGEQIEYYRRRAGEYDSTSYGDEAALGTARRRIERIVAGLGPTGDVLELACGTGMWTSVLSGHAQSLTALDSAAETIAIARARCPASVQFVQADLFGWVPGRRYDVIFFAFWLSHVPSDRLAGFFSTLAQALSPGGRVIFVDEHVSQAANESEAVLEPGVVRRHLADGSAHRLVKVYLDPERLAADLREAGWSVEFVRDEDDWLIGSCEPLRPE